MRYSKRGKRGGRVPSFDGRTRKDIHSRLAGLPAGHHSGHAHNLHGNSTAVLAMDAAKYYECAEIEESPDTHVVPRQSVTRKQLLGVFPQRIETAAIPSRQIIRQTDKRTGEIVEVGEELTDNRLTWRSDRTLLKRGNPFKDAEEGNRAGYKREGTISVGLNTQKYRASIPNADPVMETVIGPALDDDPFNDPVVELTDAEIAAALDIPE